MPCPARSSSASESVLQAPVAVLRPPRQAHAAEQDVAQLLGRADVEALAGELVDLGLDGRAGGGEIVGEAAQQLRVDEDAFHLHRREHGDQRALQRLVDGALAHGREARLQQQPEAQVMSASSAA